MHTQFILYVVEQEKSKQFYEKLLDIKILTYTGHDGVSTFRKH